MLLLLQCVWLVAIAHAATLSSDQFEALHGIFASTDGDSWTYAGSDAGAEPYDTGVHWDFEDAGADPCAQGWSGLVCSEECHDASPDPDPSCTVQELHLGDYGLAGTVTQQYSQLPSLQVLDLNTNLLRGTLPAGLGELGQLTWLTIPFNSLQGTLPDALCTLTSLSILDLSDNAFDRGTLPACIGALTALRDLELFQCNLTSSLPAAIGDMVSLTNIVLVLNDLTGSLPSTLGQLSALRFAYLSNNRLNGTLPASAMCDFALTSVGEAKVLSLASNQFSGSLPACFFYSNSTLESMYLSNNRFQGPILRAVVDPPFVPDENPYVPALLEVVDLSNNRFTGTLPVAMAAWSSLLYANVSDNFLGGYLLLSSALTRLMVFDASYNFLRGPIPRDIVTMDSMFELVLADNYLTGPIPDVNGTTVNDSYQYYLMDLSDNCLTGSIPIAFSGLQTLHTLLLGGNLLTGSLDGKFYRQSMLGLQVLDLSDNALTGTLPDVLFQLPALRSASVSKNCFTGSLPAGLCDGVSLQMLDLDGLAASPNCFRSSGLLLDIAILFETQQLYQAKRVQGALPACLFSLPNLTSLYCSGNGMISRIPDIADSSPMQTLSLSHNRFHGSVPLSLQRWDKLRYLDLSYNMISGTVEAMNYTRYMVPSPTPSPTPTPATSPLQSGEASSTLRKRVSKGRGGPFSGLLGEFDVADPDRGNETDTETAPPTSKIYLGLKSNRLSGDIPSWFRDVYYIDVLAGNMFQCTLNTLPEGDPDYEHYWCGSNQLNTTWLSVLSIGALSIILVALSAVCIRCCCGGNLVRRVVTVVDEAETLDRIERMNERLDTLIHKSSAENTNRLARARTESNFSGGTSSQGDGGRQWKECVLAWLALIYAWTIQALINVLYYGGRPLIYVFFVCVETCKRVFVKLFMFPPGVLKTDRTRHGAMEGDSGADSAVSKYHTAKIHRDVVQVLYLFVCMRRLAAILMLLALFVHLPAYSLLKHLFHGSSHTYQYGWMLSVAYLQGAVSGDVILGVWVLLLAVVTGLSMVNETQRIGNSLSAADQLAETRADSTATVASKQPSKRRSGLETAAYYVVKLYLVLFIFLNCICMVAANGVYIYVSLTSTPFVSGASLYVFVMFKTFWNIKIVPMLLRSRPTYLLRGLKLGHAACRWLADAMCGDNDGRRDARSFQERVSTFRYSILTAPAQTNNNAHAQGTRRHDIRSAATHSFLLIFNNIIAPAVATVLSDSSCLAQVIVAPPPIRTSFQYPVCQEFNISSNVMNDTEVQRAGSSKVSFDNICLSENYVTVSTVFEAPFNYSFQCGSALLTNYIPVFLLMYGVGGILVPCVQWLAVTMLEYVWRDEISQATGRATEDPRDSSPAHYNAHYRTALEAATVASPERFAADDSTPQFQRSQPSLPPMRISDHEDGAISTGSADGSPFHRMHGRKKPHPNAILDDDSDQADGDGDSEDSETREEREKRRHDSLVSRLDRYIRATTLLTVGVLSRMHWPILACPDFSSTRQPNDPNNLYRIQNITCGSIAGIGVLLSFGMAYPPLAVVITFSLCSSTYLLQSIITSHLNMCCEHQQLVHSRRLEEEEAAAAAGERRQNSMLLGLGQGQGEAEGAAVISALHSASGSATSNAGAPGATAVATLAEGDLRVSFAQDAASKSPRVADDVHHPRPQPGTDSIGQPSFGGSSLLGSASSALLHSGNLLNKLQFQNNWYVSLTAILRKECKGLSNLLFKCSVWMVLFGAAFVALFLYDITMGPYYPIVVTSVAAALAFLTVSYQAWFRQYEAMRRQQAHDKRTASAADFAHVPTCSTDDPSRRTGGGKVYWTQLDMLADFVQFVLLHYVYYYCCCGCWWGRGADRGGGSGVAPSGVDVDAAAGVEEAAAGEEEGRSSGLRASLLSGGSARADTLDGEDGGGVQQGGHGHFAADSDDDDDADADGEDNLFEMDPGEFLEA